jgi:hypothetical protein
MYPIPIDKSQKRAKKEMKQYFIRFLLDEKRREQAELVG